MSRETAFSAQSFESLNNYILKTFKPETEALKGAREHSDQMGLPPIQVSALDGRLLQFFVLLLKPECVVEIGTLGGYSALCMAQALQHGARLYTFEKNPNHIKTSQHNFKNSEFAAQITLIEGDALHNLNLQKLTPQIVFIDAEKSKYLDYYEWAVQNLSPGGLIIADNTLAFNSVHLPLDPTHPRAKSIAALKAYNEQAGSDKRVFSILIPTAEGMTLSIKKDCDDAH